MPESRNIIPVRMAKISKDDQSSVTAVTRLQDVMAVDNIREILADFEKQYKQMVKEIGTILSEMKGSTKTDPLMCWKIGDMVYHMLHKARKEGIALTNYERTLARDLHISPSRIFYFLRFRELHLTLSDVDLSIPWSWYLELNFVKDQKKLKSYETDIKNGRIKTIKELKMLIRGK